MAKLTNGNEKSVVEVMEILAGKKNMNLGIDEIEFPDGTKEKFFYNGEEDRKAAIEFAQICLDSVNGNVPQAKSRMYTCFMLKTKGIKPTYVTALSDGATYYIDHAKGILCDKVGNIIVELEEDEKAIDCSVDVNKMLVTRLLEERAEKVIWKDCCDCEDDYDEDYEDEDCEDEDYDI
jgi:hypothetical protein